jgi:hypothetical protein
MLGLRNHAVSIVGVADQAVEVLQNRMRNEASVMGIRGYLEAARAQKVLDSRTLYWMPTRAKAS